MRSGGGVCTLDKRLSASPGFAPVTPEDPAVSEPGDEGLESEPAPGGPELEPIPLPEVRWNGRLRNRRRERRRRRNRRLRRLGAAFAALAASTAVVALVVVTVGRLVDGDGNRGPGAAPAGAGTAAAPAGAVVAPVLLAHQDAAGRASSLTVLVPAAGGKGGTVVLVPPGTMTEVASLGLEPVRQSLEVGGPSRLQATVENLLGAGLGGVVAVDDAGLTNLVSPAGPLSVRVPERVEDVGPNGRVAVVYEAGPATLPPASVGRFLSARGRGTDLARLARHQAFWDAWLARLRDRPSAVPPRSPELKAALAALAAGPVDTRLVPVEAFGSSPETGELYKVRGDELGRLVASVFPASSRHGQAERPRVQVLNGTGALELADAVRAKLGPGYDVRLTGNAARFDYERTEIVFYEKDQEAVANRLRQSLGVGTLVLSRRPLDVVDVTVIVGRDFQR